MNWFRWFLTRPWETTPRKVIYPFYVVPGDTVIAGDAQRVVTKGGVLKDEAELRAFVSGRE